MTKSETNPNVKYAKRIRFGAMILVGGNRTGDELQRSGSEGESGVGEEASICRAEQAGGRSRIRGARLAARGELPEWVAAYLSGCSLVRPVGRIKLL